MNIYSLKWYHYRTRKIAILRIFHFLVYWGYFLFFSLHARQFQKCQKIWSIDIKDPVSFPSQRYHWRGIRKKLNLGQIWNSVLHFFLAKEIRSWSNIKFNFTFCISRYWYPDAMGYYYHFFLFSISISTIASLHFLFLPLSSSSLHILTSWRTDPSTS